MVISNHVSWFFYFAEHAYTLSEVASFFGLLVWTVPFVYFISLSANEYTLPNFGNLIFLLKENTPLFLDVTHALSKIKIDPTAQKRKSQEGLDGLGASADISTKTKKGSNYIKNFVKSMWDTVQPYFLTHSVSSSKSSSLKNF